MFLDGQGTATYNTTALSAGPHPISVTYTGDTTFNAAASSVQTYQVNKSPTSITLSSSLNLPIQAS